MANRDALGLLGESSESSADMRFVTGEKDVREALWEDKWEGVLPPSRSCAATILLDLLRAKERRRAMSFCIWDVLGVEE